MSTSMWNCHDSLKINKGRMLLFLFICFVVYAFYYAVWRRFYNSRYSWVCISQCLVYCVVFCRPIFLFLFCHCCVCSSVNYVYWLSLWYLNRLFFIINLVVLLTFHEVCMLFDVKVGKQSFHQLGVLTIIQTWIANTFQVVL